MSSDDQDQMDMGTKPIEDHQWLNKLVGEWNVESEMTMPGGESMVSHGTESVKSLGGLWAFGEGHSQMPNGTPYDYYTTLGYDVSFKEYRGCWFGSMSSHLWQQTGTLSEDGKTMTLDCVGPNMEVDGETANYRDVIEIVDDNTRMMTSYGQDGQGEWQEFMKSTYRRTM